MSIKRVYKALNGAGQALKSRASYQSCNLSIAGLNTKLKIMGIARIATVRSKVAMRVKRSNMVLNYIQISMRARNSSL